MKTLYLECTMGAAGDMLMGALLELYDNPQDFINTMNGLGIPGVTLSSSTAAKCGINGTHISVKIHGQEEHHHHHEHEHHHHSTLSDIQGLIQGLDLPSGVKQDAAAVYRLIADAESKAHGKPVDLVHFHEVGAMDAVADIVGVCLLMHLLSPDRIIASPVHVGSGQVHTAHGVLPVPAPATAHILQGTPMYSGHIQGELCTPTGAALLVHFADSFGAIPPMSLSKTGYGMGTKDFPAANCVRAFLGETLEETNGEICELCCNLDDMTAEAVGYAMEVLFQQGALDVFTTPAVMKKSRPGLVLTCLCRADQADTFAKLLLQHTTTIGVRKKMCQRYTLGTSFETVSTKYGDVTVKTSSGYGVKKAKAEYDDIARLAKQHNVPFDTVKKEINLLLQ